MIPSVCIDEIIRSLDWYFRNGAVVRLIGIVFCRPQASLARDQIIPSLGYFHYRSGEHTNFYFAGYRQGSQPGPGEMRVDAHFDHPGWIFSERDFDNFRREVEGSSRWRYSGGTDLILINAAKQVATNPKLDLTSAISVNLEQLKEDGALIETAMLFEQIFRYAETHGANDPTWGFSDSVGIRTAKVALRSLFFSVLPEALRGDAVKATHFVVQDLGE